VAPNSYVFIYSKKTGSPLPSNLGRLSFWTVRHYTVQELNEQVGNKNK